MKQPFRFFRGELNGYYLYRLVTFLNHAAGDLVDELVYQTLYQWKLEEEVTAGELAIREEDVFNIGIIAGLFQPRTFGRVSLGSQYFTRSHIVNGKERSERGLMDMGYESFRFFRVDQDDYPDDILAEASSERKMGLVPSSAEIVGYVAEGTSLYDQEGNVLWENLLPSPPDDGTPYTTWYGERFLIHEEYFDRETPLTFDVYKLLLECVQRIRRNGVSVGAFLEITQVLGEGYICNIEIVPAARHYEVWYDLDELVDVWNRERRFAAWKNVCNQKFKLYDIKRREEE
jgi:hypothetical protein